MLDYFTGIKINQSVGDKKKLFWLWLSIIVNLGFLGIFKYYNFFAISFVNFLASIGLKIHVETLNIILPVGISFYTFHGLSYVIDIYKNKIKPERNFIDYSLFVSFFPLLVAGPIERATHLLPQIIKRREFNYLKAVDGLKQILWGLFKKIVIADNCAEYANVIFNNSQEYTGSTLVLGVLFFTFQIYCDFSGYSDIALGTARLFGIELLRNFAYPYFSRDIAEFWRRWHISLSSWFKDYLYFPLGGSKLGKLITIRNTFVIFLVSGFWHGANWTFIVWGFLNALYILPSIIFNTNRNNLDVVASGRNIPSLGELLSMGITFGLTAFAWIFFRANDVSHAFSFISEIFSSSLLSIPYFRGIGNAVVIVPIIFLFILIEWIGREGQYAISQIGIKWKRPIRYFFYYILLFMILYFGNFNESQFIYFQF
ncbi:MBOAT family O-acyltransferase [Aquirufa nivalisilvae]|uniref:MBOAT family O-acyltransferase n=1 Tax=Aquirufa nivalisilvae TaxID=2516557 RepID=UPI002E75DC6D|nr:MBOAT family O-acyltransferase [Aquirufa nivalisilvae]